MPSIAPERFNMYMAYVRTGLFAALLLATLAGAQLQSRYYGPKPPQPDLPYLVHGDTLLATEAATAAQQERKDQTVYTVPGESSSAKTPLASPVFVVDAAKIDATKLQLYRFDVRSGHREIVFRKKGKSSLQPIGMSVSAVSGTLFRLEVVPGLENGEYSLSPEGSNVVFCFSVF